MSIIDKGVTPLNNIKPSQRRIVGWLVIVMLVLASTTAAQIDPALDSVCIVRIDPVEGKGASAESGQVGARIEWRVLNPGLTPDTLERRLDAFEQYRVRCYYDNDLVAEAKTPRTVLQGAGHAVFDSLEVGTTYHFVVEGLRSGAAPSQSEVFVFRRDAIISKGFQFSLAYPILRLLDRLAWFEGAADAMDRSSKPGRWAFELIAAFLVLGLLIWLFRTRPSLQTTQVFLADRKLGSIDEVERAMVILREASTPIDNKLAALERDDNLAKLPILLQGHESNLRELVTNNLTRGEFHGSFGGIFRVIFFWERLVRKRHADPKRFHHMPTVRILKTATSALAGEESSVQLQKAIEIRVTEEEEELRKNSHLDILWAIGVTAPLVGLFGTVTGISESFKVIAHTSARNVHLMSYLAEGINEALYTTIAGLMVGIIFMLIYYYYDFKLDRIHAMWALFAARFIDTFKHGLGSTVNSEITL